LIAKINAPIQMKVYKGSVKDLIVLKEPSETTGIGRFVFSDRYSVFDYGVMPDLIEDKGKSLCMISAYFFEKLEENDINTHYIGLVENDSVKRFDEIEEATNTMQIKLVRVFKPKKTNGYDYSIFSKLEGNYLIPLEVIYRNYISESSSLLKRIQRGEVKPEDFGLKEVKPNQRLEKPILDFSTKLEDFDRYISYDEAKRISGLRDDEFEEMKTTALKINDVISREVEKIGLINEDGKIEFALDDKRNLMVVDAVGTPDECRFKFNKFEVSKEVLRKFYRNTEWFKRVQELKGLSDWRKLVGEPPKLPEDLRINISNLYKALCNEITGRRFFDVPKLKEVLRCLNESCFSS